jgi:Zn finger protein HypA/HybF involved in hydrogenase expression
VHEVSLVAALIEECERRTVGRPVLVVRIRHASSIPEAALQQAFQMLTPGSGLSEARLDAEPFDIEFSCGCGFSGVLGHDDVIGGSVLVCPVCGDVSTLPRTAELELLAVETVPQPS